MKLEQQVCSLGLAKRLKELGVKQESYWVWVADVHHKNPLLWRHADVDTGMVPFWAPAFTVSELGEMLPGKIKSLDEQGFFREKIVDIPSSRYEVLYADPFDGRMIEPKLATGSIRAATEADARAMMLTYLMDKKLIGIS